MAPSWSPSPLLSLATHTHSHTVKREMERGTVVDSRHLTTPSSGWLEWLVCKAKWMMSAKKGEPHTKWMSHSTQNTTLPNQSPFYHSPIPCPHTPIHVPSAPTLVSSNATTTPSATNKNKKEEEGLMVAQKNKWTPPQKQGNTMGTCMAGLV